MPENDHQKIICPWESEIKIIMRDVSEFKSEFREFKTKSEDTTDRIYELEKARAVANGVIKQSRFDWKTVIVVLMMLTTLIATLINALKG